MAVSADQFVQLLLGLVGLLATTLAGLAWRRVDAMQAELRATQAELRALQREVDRSQFVDRATLEEVVRDEISREVKPITAALDRITDWIEAQNGSPNIRGRV